MKWWNICIWHDVRIVRKMCECGYWARQRASTENETETELGRESQMWPLMWDIYNMWDPETELGREFQRWPLYKIFWQKEKVSFVWNVYDVCWELWPDTNLHKHALLHHVYTCIMNVDWCEITICGLREMMWYIVIVTPTIEFWWNEY